MKTSKQGKQLAGDVEHEVRVELDEEIVAHSGFEVRNVESQGFLFRSDLRVSGK